jgi:hypothetical protein
MRKKGYYIFILLIFYIHTQGLCASLCMLDSSFRSLELSKHCKSVLCDISETSETMLQYKIDYDFTIFAVIDTDNEDDISWSLSKKNSTGRDICSKQPQYVLTQRYSNARGKYRFPHLHHLSSPQYIFLRVLRI